MSRFWQDAGLKGDTDEGECKMESGTAIAILPCNDLDASERFYGPSGLRALKGDRRKSWRPTVCYRTEREDFI